MKIGSQIFIFALIVALFYLPMFLYALRLVKHKAARRRFFKAIVTIAKDTTDDKLAVERIKISYTRLCDIFPHVPGVSRGYGDLLEDFYFRAISLSQKAFKENYSIEVDDALRARLASLVSAFRVSEPYASVSSKFGNLLFTTERAINSKNDELGKSSLTQIAQEIQVLEKRDRIQAKQTVVATVISIVGVILTIVFGVVSLLPLFKNG